MRNLMYMLLFIFPGLMIAQCTISGNAAMNAGDESVYTVTGDAAQCADCHLWVTVGSNTTISGDNRQQAVKLKAVAGGRQVLSAAVLTPQGLVQCSKNIDITDGKPQAAVNTSVPDVQAQTATAPQTTKVDCDIEVNNYKEVKYAEGIVTFFPNVNQSRYSYEWTANYATGEIMKSTEKVPQFPYTKEESITVVKLRVVSSACMREFTKTYDSSYWRWF